MKNDISHHQVVTGEQSTLWSDLTMTAVSKGPAAHGQKLTSTLLTVASTVSFGTWFVMGYMLVALNGLQFVIVNWIRAVKCTRLGGIFTQRYNDSVQDLWCRHYELEEEANILPDNSELNQIWAISSSIITVGGLLGTFFCTTVIARLGTKGSLLFTNMLFTVGAVTFASAKWADSFELLIVGRFVVGCAMAFICVVPPLYVTDLTPPGLRGAVGSMPMILYDAGMILGTSFSLPMLLGTEESWPFLILVPLIPVAILCAALPFFPNSPRSLLASCDNADKAREALVWLRRSDDVDQELTALQYALDHEQSQQISVTRFFRTPFLRSTFIICFVAMVSQQFSGYLCIVFYSTSIFNSVGLTQVNAVYATTGLWVTLLSFALLSSVLMERLGRRTLLLGGNLVEGLALALLVGFMALTKQDFEWSKYASVACLFLFIASYGLGPLTVPWILPTELFTADCSATSMTWTAVTCWAGSLLTTFIFPVVVASAEEYTFIIFIAFLLVTSVFLYLRQPETKGRSVLEVQAVLRHGKEY